MLKKLMFAAAALAIATPALAHRDHDDDRRGYRHGHHQHWKHQYYYRQARPVVVVPAPRVYYSPPPTVYYAPPSAPGYYAPPPVYPGPVPHSGVSIRLHFPL